MVNILVLVAGLLVMMGLNWYKGTFLGGLTVAPNFLLSFILSYLVIQLFFYIFPPLKRIMMALGAPFRYMHVWLHVDMARRIELNKYGINNKEIPAVGFWGENKGNDMVPLLHTYFDTRDALKIASAPLLGAGALFIFLVLSAPMFAALGLFGLLFHIYLLFCCFGIAFPSFKDYSFLVQGTTVKSGSLHPGYFLWIYFIFAISGYITLQNTGDAVAAIKDGIFYSVFYIVLLFVISKIGERNAVKG